MNLAKLIIAIIMSLWFSTAVGCSQGTRQWYEKSEPQTCIVIDPISKTVKLFDNNGRAVTLDKAVISKTDGGRWSFEINNLNITEKSVENRVASAEQDKAWFEGSAVMYKALLGEGGIAGIVTAAMPGITSWISAHPQSAQNPDILKGFIESALKEQMAKKITGG